MKYTSVLAQGADGRLWLKSPGLRAAAVCRVADACRLLGRTRRQVYRYLQEGVLVPRGKMLGEWLLDEKAVRRAAQSPPAVWRLPAGLQPLFPEYEVSRLNAGRDKALVVSRVLESGSRKELRWLLRRYPERELAGVVRTDGGRLLSPRALRFWALYFGVRPPSLRRRGSDPWASRSP